MKMPNMVTIAIAVVLVLIVAGAVYWMYRDRKAGKHCGGCSGCSTSSACTSCPDCVDEDAKAVNVTVPSDPDVSSEDDDPEEKTE